MNAFAHIQQLSFVSLLFAHKAFAQDSVHYSSPGMHSQGYSTEVHYALCYSTVARPC